MPQTKVDWTSNNASSQFKLWRKEAERIIGGRLAARSDRVKYIHTYILYWLVPTGLFRVNFTLQNYKPST